MAEATASVSLNEALLEQRTSTIYSQLTGAFDVAPLSAAIGLETALRVLARALAAFETDPPPFNWVYTIQGGTARIFSKNRPPEPEFGLQGLQLFREVSYLEGQRNLITLGVRTSFGLPASAEVFVATENLAAEGEEQVINDSTRVECGNPLGPVMFMAPCPDNPRPYPRAVPIPTTSFGGSATIRAATEMGRILGRRLAEHYHLTPVP